MQTRGCPKCHQPERRCEVRGAVGFQVPPMPALVKYVEAGWLGRKTNRGFYDYTQNPPRPTR